MTTSMLVMILMIGVGALLMVAERIFPDQRLEEVPGWWGRVIIVNILQLGIVILGGVTWNIWFARYSLLSLQSTYSLSLQILLAYIAITFVYYWWHRWRHDIQFLWLTCHQLHHSPSRIETITSFYKHPVELIANGILIACINFTVLGISIEAGAWVTCVTAMAEFFYHMNIKTPRWVGYFLQRPEMHRIHHQRGKHYNNFSDLPVWDMLFGTYENPASVTTPCGFKRERELSFTKMLAFDDVNVTSSPTNSTPSDKKGA
jgi:sterol desaturase/sphingolipid hydroxylase (fatty acid hydroxylase superfamily)